MQRQAKRASGARIRIYIGETGACRRLVAAGSRPKWSEKVEKLPPPWCFAARPAARPLGAASPLSNPNTQHTCLSVRIAQGLSESIALDLQLCRKSHAAARAPRRRGCSPGWSAARAHRCLAYRFRRSTRRPQVVPAWSCAFIRHPQLITCRLHDGIAGLVCWLRRMFPVAARHAARLSMITVNGLHHWGGTGRALEHRSHAPARPRTKELVRASSAARSG